MNKALLVIDFINDIAHPDGRIAASAAHVLEQDAIAHANHALAHARANGWLVVLIKVGFDGG
ncbi:MAG: cysteine hydrolase, partial [Aeromonas veronii]